MMGDRCVICDTYVPEGRMVCSSCEKSVEKAFDICVNQVACKRCPIRIQCTGIGADQLGEVFKEVNERKGAYQKAADWLQGRFLKKQ